VSRFEPWALYASPAVGLLVGTLCGLAFFVASGVLRLLLDQRDLLEELVEAQQRIRRPAESRQPSGASGTQDPFDLTEIRRAEESPL
jgi:hypothetical protein